ncbi:hypothetical protein, conserved [Angomonas deanei]|uniref:Leucine rich repeat N-terminal domain containing protein n=1 Tax=Angomonas deanei TaxID=59799 RepID=A0A7G2CLW6_9TRYP|nr:hypothetical protein, conserved [Angomonas deanei]
MSFIKPTFIATLLLVVFAMPGNCELTEEQKAATWDFLAGFQKRMHLDWNVSNHDFCLWSGISCNPQTGYVSIEMSGKGVKGFLPVAEPANGDLIMVESVDMSNNPDIVGAPPATWSVIKALTSLKFSHTTLRGSIPDEWANLINLVSVDLSNTWVCLNLPKWGSSMAKLTTLNVANAKLNGRLSDTFVDLPALVNLDLTGNDFCGCMPYTWKGHPILVDSLSTYPQMTQETCSFYGCDKYLVCPKIDNGALSGASTAVAGCVVATLVSLLLVFV